MDKVDLRANRTNVATLAYVQLVNAVRSRQLRPGQKLHIEELAATMNISKTPVKEALMRLVSDGLMTMDPVRGMRVVVPTPKGLADLYDARLVCELYGIEKGLPQAPEQALSAVVVAFQSWHEALASGQDYWVVSDLDGQLHEAIVQLGDNERIADWYQKLKWYLHTSRINYGSSPRVEIGSRADADHRALAEACLARDVPRASQVVKAHIAWNREWNISMVEGKQNANP